ncbi:anti-oxidant AhpCTSA family protein [Alishewanella aestuarii B11]|uniref:Anti-oxidant AhpCTSA family protein n=1 Tax=Alishewanella aestuarii B11 TaxID=1197174 RepID=J2IG06_9ALTE|nr:thiol peroxidase [Alishewanella aestuarii]EJI86152.1 anti-oxidant AhpCTSA family protein [Alishewanella aestuarii B11]
MFKKRKNNTKILFTLILAAAAFTSQAIDITANLPARISDVKAGGQQIVLLGDELKVGQQAPDFKVVDNSFKPVRLSDFQGKTLMLSIVPSIDTGICSLQTKRFNEEVAKLPDSVQLLTISTDLPFAQKRFCEQEQVNNMAVLSDAVWRDFGSSYGLLIKDMGLLTRAIIIINQQGKVAYLQLVPELAQEPDYDTALQVLRQTIGS